MSTVAGADDSEAGREAERAREAAGGPAGGPDHRGSVSGNKDHGSHFAYERMPLIEFSGE